jgi:hypothetical protein
VRGVAMVEEEEDSRIRGSGFGEEEAQLLDAG